MTLQLIIDDSQPFTHDFPCANIYEMISPDMLHQLIKGIFKDHLVTWVCNYLLKVHGKTRGNAILNDIDRQYIPLTMQGLTWHWHWQVLTSNSIAAVPPFPGLRRFPQGRRFKQWTGDDSKALMKVRPCLHSGMMKHFSERYAGIYPCDRRLCPGRNHQVYCSFPRCMLHCPATRYQ